MLMYKGEYECVTHIQSYICEFHEIIKLGTVLYCVNKFIGKSTVLL